MAPYGAEAITSNIHQVETIIVRNDHEKVLMTGEYIEVHSEELKSFDGEIALEPHTDSPLSGTWPPPTITRVVQGSVRIPNNGPDPIKISSTQHIAQIRRVKTIPDVEHPIANHETITVNENNITNSHQATSSTIHSSEIQNHSDNMLTKEERHKFSDIHKRYDAQFTSEFGAYNDHSGYIRTSLHMGPVEPPQCKGKLPFYNTSNMQQLQIEADKLEELGVLRKPEDMGITVKYVSPSFLKKKPDGGYRFVTAFNNLGQYTRILPTVTPTTDDILRKISQFEYLIKTDFTKSFYQIKVAKSSMPYLATVTPFKGIRVYARSANGMPGCTEYLEELTARVFGDFVQEGWLALIADDLFIGGSTSSEILDRWTLVLQRLKDNNLTLNPKKTFICPKKCTILGWNWCKGTISPTSHKISALASVSKPKTCTAMKSFIGAFRAISRCIPHYTSLLAPLENSIKGIQGAQHVTWTPQLESSFNEAQAALRSPRTLTIPTPDDKLVLTVDASPSNDGIGATLFILRNERRLLAGFYSFKLKTHQIGWLPCELEALAITAGVKHFAPYSRESHYPMQVLSDSKPCVLAYKRLCSGQFSASARVSTFLSCISSYNITISHISGKDNSSSDFSSRNPQECNDQSCEICKFVHETAESVVNAITVSDIISGNAQLPFLNRNAWKAAQRNCHNMRRAFAHLTQGTSPSRKARHIKNLRKYLRVCTVDSNGLLIVRKQDPLHHERPLIVVPYDILPGIITAMHLHLKHPTIHQLTQVFDRYFYGITSKSIIANIVNQCSQCNSMKKIPKELMSQSTTTTPSNVGEIFYADVLAREKQHIIVTRDVHSSYTCASIIEDEKGDTLRTGLIINTAILRSDTCTVRVDTAPGFKALKNDATLASIGMTIDYGRIKNKDSNSVIDKGIQELEEEILKHEPSGTALTPIQLQIIVDTLNSRIRNRGLSAKEIIFKRDQFTDKPIQIEDSELSKQQSNIRDKNHIPSARSKARGNSKALEAPVVEGDLVYIKNERNKNKIRDRYIITLIDKDKAHLQKLNDKFMSKQYVVPLTNIYLATPPSASRKDRYHDWDYRPSSSSTSDSDSEIESDTEQDSDSVISDIEQDNADNEGDIPNNPALGDHNNTHSERPNRQRNTPTWMRTGEYEI